MTEPSAYRYEVNLVFEEGWKVVTNTEHPQEAIGDNQMVEWRNVEPLYAESDLTDPASHLSIQTGEPREAFESDAEVPEFEEQEIEQTIPESDLRELIKEWHTREYHNGTENREQYRKATADCRRDLEELIDE